MNQDEFDPTKSWLPHGTVATTMHKLERSPEFQIRIEQCVPPEIYGVEFVTRELVERFRYEIVLRAQTLYSYTRFENEQLNDSARFVKTSFEHYPEGLVNIVKRKISHLRTGLNGTIRHWSYKLTGRRFSVGLPSVHKRLLPKLSSREIVTWEDRQITVERAQESLLAQIALFYKYNLKPQAVLAHPSMASELAAARTMGEQYYQQSVSVGGQATFAGLPVIACPELAQGAMVA